MEKVIISVECKNNNVKKCDFEISKIAWETLSYKELLLDDIMDIVTEMFDEKDN